MATRTCVQGRLKVRFSPQERSIMTIDPRHKSRALLDGPHRPAARAMMKGAGFTDEDLARSQIGVAHCQIGTMPCN